MLSFGGIEGEIEGCALVDFALGPDFSTMAADDALNCGEADAGAREFADRVEPLEGLEETVGEALIEACAVVTNKKDGSAVALGAAEFDFGGLAKSGEFPCIADQVLQSDLHQARIGVHLASRLNLDLHLPVGIRLSEAVEDGSGYQAQVQLLQVQGGTG